MAQYPVIAAGAKLTADLLNLMLPNQVVKTSDTTRPSNVTASNDPELIVPVLANATYEVEFTVIFGALQAAGLRTVWAIPAGASAEKFCAGPGSANTTQVDANTTEMKWTVVSAATTVLYTDPRNAVASKTWLLEKARVAVGATAGNVTFQWAQNVTNATGTIVYAGSYATYRQVA